MTHRKRPKRHLIKTGRFNIAKFKKFLVRWVGDSTFKTSSVIILLNLYRQTYGISSAQLALRRAMNLCFSPGEQIEVIMSWYDTLPEKFREDAVNQLVNAHTAHKEIVNPPNDDPTRIYEDTTEDPPGFFESAY